MTQVTHVISIHSLVKRETTFKTICQVKILYFNPLPRKEGDPESSQHFRAASNDFNPLPRKEGDCVQGRHCHQDFHFNPLPRKEGDLPPMPTT